MPAGELRLIRRRIRSVQSTRKITKAMELIAASRIMKAEQRVAASRPYALRMAKVMANLAEATGGVVDHPLLEVREETRSAAVLVIAADRGLCGAYNANVLKEAERALRELGVPERSVVAVGRKAKGYFSYRGVEVEVTFEGITDTPRYGDAKEVAGYLLRQYLDGEIDRVELVYTEFENAARQVVRRVQLLPIDTSVLTEAGLRVGRAQGGIDVSDTADQSTADTVFEPDPADILGELLPRGVESRVYSALLDSSASEHAERRRAMKSATDNADDLIRALTLAGNKARQAAITTEILEVVGGAEALAAAQ